MSEDEKWMQIAIIEANNAKIKDEIPVGAVIVKNGLLISQAHNQPISTNDPTAHAEIQAIRKAGEKERNYRLVGSIIYITLEPCAMCLGAIIHARIDRIVFGASDPKTGVCGSCTNLTNAPFFNHKVKFTGGILEEDCNTILRNFFIELR